MLAVNTKPASAAVDAQGIFGDKSTNSMWKVGKYCYDMGNVNYRCEYYESQFRSELGCGGLFFSEKAKWNVKPGAFADCFNKANVKLNAIKEKCDPVSKDDPQTETCMDVYQDPLKTVFGCDNLFQEINNGTAWKIKPNAFSACEDRAKAVKSLKLLDSKGKPLAKTVGETEPTSTDGAGSASEVDCSGGGALGWIICPIAELGQNIAKDIFSGVIEPMMKKVPVSTDPGDGSFRAWQGFRMIANILLVGALLVMVYAQATGGVFDAYTIRKLAPRVLTGVILINISIYLCVAAIDITNVIGDGLAKLLIAPFDLKKFNLDTGSTTIGALLSLILTSFAGLYAVVAIGASFFGIIALLILTIMLLSFAIMFTLVIRQTLLVLLTILAPVAIALWLLPSTEQYFKKWWDLFLKTLMVYPIIAALFAISGVMATIAFTGADPGDSGTGNVAGGFSIVTGVILSFAPLFLIPFAFKFAGGITAMTMGAFDKPLKSLSGLRSQMHKGAVAKNWQAIKEGRRWAGGEDATGGRTGNFRGRMNRRFQTAAIVGTAQAGFDPRNMSGRISAARTNASNFMKSAESSQSFQNIKDKDHLLAAAMHGDGSEAAQRAYLQAQGQDGAELAQSLGLIRSARREMGDHDFQAATAVYQAGTGSGYADEGQAGLMAAANRAAGGDRDRAQAIAFAGRSVAAQAGRGDLVGGSAGQMLTQLDNMYANGNSQASMDQANGVLMDSLVDTKNAGFIIGSRAEGVRNIIPALQRRTDQAEQALRMANLQHQAAVATGNPAIAQQAQDDLDQRRREYVQVMASNQALIDTASSASPEVARLLADGLHSGEIDITQFDPATQQMLVGNSPGGAQTVTNRVAYDQFAQNSPEYNEMIKTYNTQYAQQAAGQAAAQAAAQAAGIQGAQPPLGGGPLGGPPPPIGPAASDMRLKKNIIQVGQTANGLPLYRFQYLGSEQTYIGVIAQDLLEIQPSALHKIRGFYYVDYSKIGARMYTLEQWEEKLNKNTSPQDKREGMGLDFL